MSGKPRVALLIDADNLSAPAMSEAAAHLLREGFTLSIVRAYGSPDSLGNARDVLQRHGGRALVNQGRGTTDAALVVDAMDLLYGQLLPPVVAIASSDADFAPLAVRLREAGLEVRCFAQGNKADMAALERVYARVHEVGDESSSPAQAPAPRAAPRKAGRKTAPAPAAPAPAPAPAAPAPSRTRGAMAPAPKPAGQPAAPAPRPGSVTGEAVYALLAALPGFADGKEIALNDAVMHLRKAGLMGRNAGATAFFRKLALPVALTPASQPNRLRWLGEGA